ncbi:recombination protein F [Caulifigura coniformis]|uniref:Recombination protein F n=1 Tax=Caulifigura coniformis TaxID=2527983 RepID=A0A517SN17_9PLAN|nr:DUF4332 domain-containing protein [Caulifigura coniformis]QDT57510.1 recombination protein F [Caulifigura coniformis]
MKFTDFSIDNFGALSKYSLPEIAPGLNVLHGPNGSGKTTLLQFIRGIFAGFAEARRRQLIPPVGSGAAGGTIGVEWGSRRLAVIRHSRPDEYETLAINVRQGVADEGQSLRKQIEAFDDERLSVLFTAGSFDANSVEALISLARQDGIDLSTVVGNERPLSTRLTHLHSRRSLLLREIGEPGRRGELLLLCEAIEREALEIQRQADERKADLLRARVDVEQKLAALDRDIQALDLDWQAVSTDLSECEDRLWNATSRTVVDVVYLQEAETPSVNPRLPEVEELDLRIEHLRKALKDLAASRHELSREAAENAGSDVPDRFAFARRQRDALRVMQMQLQVLSGTVQWLASARLAGSCVCENLGERLGSVVDEMRRQVEFSCQELSRQQTAWKLEQSRTELAAVDACEQGLRKQIDWLRMRREELLEEAAHPLMSRLAHTVTAERQYCGCPQHSATMRATTPKVVTRRTVREREDVVSNARPGDVDLQTALMERQSALWSDWQSAIRLSCELEIRRRRVIEEHRSIDIDAALADCERRLQDARREVDELQAKHTELAAIDDEIRTVESQLVRDKSSRVISEASEHLDLLTLGRYRALRTSEDATKLQIIAENGSPYVASALSRGTLFQVALALRVALVDEYARRGLEFPLVLDDVLVDSDEHRLEAAAHLLSAAAERGRQILFLTCQDHLVDMLEDRGAAIHTLIGATRSRAARAPFVPAAPVVSIAATPATVPSTTEVPQDAPRKVVVTPADLSDDDLRLATEIPSLSASSAALLAHEGIHTLRQVLDLDPRAEATLLARLGISRIDLATWQAEAALLDGLPNVSKEDVRLLAAVGVHGPEKLARFTAEVLWQRIQRFRGSTPQPWHAWIRDRNSWPREDEVAEWIRAARRVRDEQAPREILALARGDAEDDSDNQDPDDQGPKPAGEGDGSSRKRTRRSRRSRFTASSNARSRGSASAETDARYFLTIDSPIVDAPSIGPKTARLLNRAGVQTVIHLLQRDPAELAENIADRAITAEVITGWQQQSRLMCEIPELRGHDAQLLVGCGFPTVDSLATSAPGEAFDAIAMLAKSKTGQRMLRSSAAPEREEIAAWVEFARSRQDRRAA